MTNKEAIEYLERLYMMADITDAYGDMDDTEPYETAIDMAVKALSDVPDTNVGKWIPCSERLPEKPNVYTVTDSNDRVVRFVFTGTDSSREYWKRCAKAWMPLPTPYREE